MQYNNLSKKEYTMLNFLRTVINNFFENSSGCYKLPKNRELTTVPQTGYFNQKSY